MHETGIKCQLHITNFAIIHIVALTIGHYRRITILRLQNAKLFHSIGRQ